MRAWLNRPVDLAPLAVFRILFGLVLLYSTVRFVANGWIESQYLEPSMYFPYFGWEWLPRPSATALYALFAIMIGTALSITLGLYYRMACLLFFLSFTYVELLDKSNYLNHYYLVSMLAALMIFLPANRMASLDVRFRPALRCEFSPWWTVNVVRVMLSSVYLFAGIAKLNGAWLIDAQPLAIWLPQHADMPVIGPLLDEPWVAYAFSWGGALFDLLVPFALWIPKLRLWAYAAVVGFHAVTAALFPIGVFPVMMMSCTLVFFPAAIHRRLLGLFGKVKRNGAVYVFVPWARRILPGLMLVFLFFHLIFPFRHVLYPGDLFWNEEGYRFSWRVMLMEKAGKAFFYVKQEGSPGEKEVLVSNYLTPNQEKQMATQPDMLRYFAHWIDARYQEQGVRDPKVRAEVWVDLNGQGSQLMLDPFTDLSALEDGFGHQSWVIPKDSVITMEDYQHLRNQWRVDRDW